MVHPLSLPIASVPILEFGVTGLGVAAKNMIFRIYRINSYDVYEMFEATPDQYIIN